MSKHATVPAYSPQSRTDNEPQKPPAQVAGIADEKAESEDELNTRLRRLMNQDNVVLFMKGSPEQPRCGFSRKIVALLKDHDIPFAHFDILTDENVRQGLSLTRAFTLNY